MSNVKIENLSKTRKRLVVPVSADEIRKAEASVVASVTREASIPGFRPGKAPEATVRAKYAAVIADELRHRLVTDSYQKALKEDQLEFCSVVDIEGADEINPADPKKGANIKVTVDVYPEFKTPTYKELIVKLPKAEVDEKEIDKTLDLIRGQRAQFNAVEREAQKGDYVRLSYYGTLNGKPVAEIVADKPIYGTQKNTWEEAGHHEYGIKAITEGLIGMKKGEKKTVVMEFEKKFEVRELAGKKVNYEIEVLEVREKKMPEMNEEFFKSVGVKDLEELKKNIRTSLESRAKEDQENAKRAQLSDALVNSVDFPLPESLTASESQSILNELIEENQKRGVSEEAMKKNEKQLIEAAKEAAQKRVKLRLILRVIAKEEKLEVTQEDLQRYVMTEAMRSQSSPEKIAKELSSDREKLSNLQQALKLGKAMKVVVDGAKVEEGEKKVEGRK
jgi:trigger factor